MPLIIDTPAMLLPSDIWRHIRWRRLLSFAFAMSCLAGEMLLAGV